MSEGLPEFVIAYDEIVNEWLGAYLSLSATIGGAVNSHALMVKNAVDAQRQFLITASKCRRPSDPTLMDLLKPTSDRIQEIQQLRERNRSHELFNHLSAISESIPALGWVAVAPTPGPYVKEMNDASQFYTNKVLVAYKDKNKTHIDWAKSWLTFLTQLQAYIKRFHTTGLSWNPNGAEVNVSAQTGPPGPPPPPPPVGFFDDMKKDDGRGALFASINRGEAISKGLKHVSADQQTHKNPGLRQTGPQPYKSPSAAGKGVPAITSVISRVPKFALEGKKWMIENQIGQKTLLIDNTEMNQSVNVYKCEDCVLQVKGKINSITVDLSKKFSIVFDNIVSFVEFINCQQIQAQAMGVVPTLTVDKTDGAEVYLSKESLSVEIITSKSSAINVSVPDSRTGDYVEHPLPEQFKTVWDGKAFQTLVIKKD